MDSSTGSTLSSLILFLLLSAIWVGIALWLGRRAGLFRYPALHVSGPLRALDPMTLLKLVGAIIITLSGLFVISVLALVLFPQASRTAATSLGQALFLTCVQALLLAILLGYSRLLGRPTWTFLFGTQGQHKSFGLGVLTWLIAFPCSILISTLITLLLYPFFGLVEGKQDVVEAVRQLAEHPGLFALLAFSIIVLVPITEELLFRGYLQGWLRRHLSARWAILITALLFALAHFSLAQGVGNFPILAGLFVLGLFLGHLFERERTILANIALHATFNAFTMVTIGMELFWIGKGH